MKFKDQLQSVDKVKDAQKTMPFMTWQDCCDIYSHLTATSLQAVHFSQRAILISKLGQSDLVLVCAHSLLVPGLWVQDYKSLCAAVTICGTLVNIQTHTDNILASLYEEFSQLKLQKLSSASVRNWDFCTGVDAVSSSD